MDSGLHFKEQSEENSVGEYGSSMLALLPP